MLHYWTRIRVYDYVLMKDNLIILIFFVKPDSEQTIESTVGFQFLTSRMRIIEFAGKNNLCIWLMKSKGKKFAYYRYV